MKDKPCRGEFGYKKEFRCNRCSETFSERELIEANARNRSDTPYYCPECGSDDWGENETCVLTVMARGTVGDWKSLAGFDAIKERGLCRRSF